MKTKLFLLTALLTTGVAAVNAQTSFGIRAGVNFQNLNGEDVTGDDFDYKLKTGFHVGVNAEIPLAAEFYLQPGVLFSMKGAKADDDNDTKVNIGYIEVPINFLFKPELGNGKLLLGVGPYVGFGVTGKIKGDGDDVDIEFANEASGLDALRTIRRFDAGGNLLFGYEFSNKLSLQLNAQLGMLNIAPDIEGVPDNDYKIKNTGFGVSVGYRF
ncbi:MAG: porin family protein [Candidatus Pseudobacter hemicellulosilyticus]|uniref:Porin family protein n=1 Tax=Candidatus Pseudobacter hemicellulosilyticus TaxID=3121375 RepID=A0AAJ5WWR8_9BACT|nr:MAG: porin family protein [Pseudobacter sp.]